MAQTGLIFNLNEQLPGIAEDPELVQIPKEEEERFEMVEETPYMGAKTASKVLDQSRLIEQMEPTVAQVMKAVAWNICTDTFERIKGSEAVKEVSQPVKKAPAPKPQPQEWTILFDKPKKTIQMNSVKYGKDSYCYDAQL